MNKVRAENSHFSQIRNESFSRSTPAQKQLQTALILYAACQMASSLSLPKIGSQAKAKVTQNIGCLSGAKCAKLVWASIRKFVKKATKYVSKQIQKYKQHHITVLDVFQVVERLAMTLWQFYCILNDTYLTQHWQKNVASLV